MRALEVLGLDADGGHLLCQDPSSGEEFSVPCDERLRAAVRGDLSRLGQLQIEMESQLRPKEIQARIRAGATVEEVAAAAGTAPSRIDRFAYPVLMERATMAERARVARPVGAAGPAAHSIAEIVADTLSTRGIAAEPQWDAYKDARGWVLLVRWQAGRSENSARFDLHLGSDGGTVVPRDDAAGDLLDPAPKPPRLSNVAQLSERPAPKAGRRAMASLLEQTADVPASQRAEPAQRAEQPGSQPVPAPQPAAAPARRQVAETASTPEARAQQPATAPASGRPVDRRAEQAVRDEVAHPKPAQRDPGDVVAETVRDERSAAGGADEPAEPAQAQAHTGTDGAPTRPGNRKSGRSKPAMPSWDDVLLGGSRRR